MHEEFTLDEASDCFDHFKPVLLGGGNKELKQELDNWLKDYGWRQDIEV